MPGMGGLAGAAKIRERAPDARILFLSMHDQARDVRQAFDAGADGYLLKSAADEDLVRAVRAVASGERYVHPSLGAVLASTAVGGPSGRADLPRAGGPAAPGAGAHQPGDRRVASSSACGPSRATAPT